MATINRKILNLINSIIKKINLKIDTTTIDIQRDLWIAELEKRNVFNEPKYPPLINVNDKKYLVLAFFQKQFQNRFETFLVAQNNDVGFSYSNSYFTGIDANIYYTIIRKYSPKQIIEVGCGNSTKVARQAIMDGKLETKLITIDPMPRADITRFSDNIITGMVETSKSEEYFMGLKENDILFIDSSHEVKPFNDVTYLFLNILPLLKSGVLIHIHDIFLPYEYPEEWIKEGYLWNEQYLLQALLQSSKAYDILWSGYYIQKHNKEVNIISDSISIPRSRAQSFWMRKR